jgi:hypothetical protein
MRRMVRCGRYLARLAALAVALGWAIPVIATPLEMAKLPVVEPFRCAVCHVESPENGGGTALNAFGADFLGNLRRWNAALADRDSDRDGCLNGVELGDSDGDGAADGNAERLVSNPGVADCGASLDVTTWGELKALFESR